MIHVGILELQVVVPPRAEGPLGLKLSDVHGPDQPPVVTGLLKDGPADSPCHKGP